MSEIWDNFCSLDYEQQDNVDEVSLLIYTESSAWEDADNLEIATNHSLSKTNSTPSSAINQFQTSLVKAESSCHQFVLLLDKSLGTLDDVARAYSDVTSRTNSLIINCENLLEQQYSLQATVEALKRMLDPLNEAEAVAGQLGIPVDAKGNPIHRSSSVPSIDPRSKEFRYILKRIIRALNFLRVHADFRERDQYLKWLEQLQNRATSLVVRTILDMLDNAKKSCSQKLYKSSSGRSLASLEASPPLPPLESSVIYQKFRGLAYRLQELNALLPSAADDDGGGDDEEEEEGGDQGARRSASSGERVRERDTEAEMEVRRFYVQARSELLQLVVLDSTKMPASSSKVSGDSGNDRDDTTGISSRELAGEAPTNSSAGLCIQIRQSYALLLRVAHLEYHLFNSLFGVNGSVTSPEVPDGSGGGTLDAQQTDRQHQTQLGHAMPSTSDSLASFLGPADEDLCPDVRDILESACRAVGDAIRPLIIHEAEVDSLCRVITALAEDVRSQILGLRLPRILLRCLLTALDRTVTDAQERLAYCAEVKLRQEVHLFEPLHSQLAYPDILEDLSTSNGQTMTTSHSKNNHQDRSQHMPNPSKAQSATTADEIARSWYPSLRSTLSLLSKLYGVVDRVVFDDFARRGVSLCVHSLRAGAEGVRRVRSQLHADLFLVRHLLILREQLLPFEIRMTSVELVLDFSSTGQALSSFMLNSQAWLRMDSNNALFHVAREGLPMLKETQVDGKRELDVTLKTACTSLKSSCVRMLMEPLEAFLAKVTAFLGEIVVSNVLAADGTTIASAKRTPNSMSAFEESKLPPGTSPYSPAALSSLQNQAFMRPDRIRELLQTAVRTVAEGCPELKHALQLYIENSVARAILLKPIQQDVENIRMKLESVIVHTVESSQAQQELLQTVTALASTIISELTH